MPIYEYQCEKCGEIVEVMQKISDEPLTECPHCKGNMRKLISQTAFQLKGSGWYVTDYKKKINTSSKKETKTGNNTKNTTSCSSCATCSAKAVNE